MCSYGKRKTHTQKQEGGDRKNNRGKGKERKEKRGVGKEDEWYLA